MCFLRSTMHRFEKQTYDKVCDSYWVNARLFATPSCHYRDRNCSADSALTDCPRLCCLPGNCLHLQKLLSLPFQSKLMDVRNGLLKYYLQFISRVFGSCEYLQPTSSPFLCTASPLIVCNRNKVLKVSVQ